MADVPPYPGAPRWVKIFGTIAVAIFLLFMVGMFHRGAGAHGPHRHAAPSKQR